MSIRFDGKVAVITGAGGGIGEALAMELAHRGAAVVVNDYGGDVYGTPGTISRAAEVASKITRAGGRAVADGTQVGAPGSAQAIVKAALDSFGQVDILINNAGNMGTGSIAERSDADFARTLAVHLQGSYSLMRAVWPSMLERGGRILNTVSSLAFGHQGWSNYCAAKSGLVGLTKAAGLEGAPNGIIVNGIMPVAYTRMAVVGVEGPALDWMMKNFPPAKVAQAAVYLVSDQVKTSDVFVVGGGRLARVGYSIAKGFFDAEITAEKVAEGFDRAMDMTDATIIFSTSGENATYLPFIPLS